MCLFTKHTNIWVFNITKIAFSQTAAPIVSPHSATAQPSHVLQTKLLLSSPTTRSDEVEEWTNSWEKILPNEYDWHLDQTFYPV